MVKKPSANKSCSYLIHGKHPLEKINEFSSVNFLCKKFSSLQICGNVDLTHVLQAIEDVLPAKQQHNWLRPVSGIADRRLWLFLVQAKKSNAFSCCARFGRRKYSVLQWGSEYRTSQVFKWSKVVQ